MIRIGDNIIRFCGRKAKGAMYLSISTFILSSLFYHPLTLLINLASLGVVLIAWIPILFRR